MVLWRVKHTHARIGGDFVGFTMDNAQPVCNGVVDFVQLAMLTGERVVLVLATRVNDSRVGGLRK